MSKAQHNLDRSLTLALADRCSCTGNVYSEPDPDGNDYITAEFSDGDVEVRLPEVLIAFLSDYERAMIAVRRLLVAHGEIEEPGQL